MITTENVWEERNIVPLRPWSTSTNKWTARYVWYF